MDQRLPLRSGAPRDACRQLVSSSRPDQSFSTLDHGALFFFSWQISKAREARLRPPRSFPSCSSSGFSVSASLASPSLPVSAPVSSPAASHSPVSSSAHVFPSPPVACVSSDCSLLSAPSCTPPPREMDTIDRSVERMRLRAIELDRDCDLKLAQLKALVASGIWTKPSADKSYDYSTDSPTPHTISNWDSTLEEDRFSSYSFTHMPTPSARIPAALAEWDTSSSSDLADSVVSVSSLPPVPPVPSTPPRVSSPAGDPVLRKFARNVTKAHFAARGEELPLLGRPPLSPIALPSLLLVTQFCASLLGT